MTEPKTIDARCAELRAAIRAAVEALGHTWKEYQYERDVQPSLWVDDARIALHLYGDPEGQVRVRYGVPSFGGIQELQEPITEDCVLRIARQISGIVKSYHADLEAHNELVMRMRANLAIVDAINADLGCRALRGPRARVNLETGRLMACIDIDCTEEQARALLAAAKRIYGGDT